MNISDTNTFLTLRFLLPAALGLIAVLAGVLLFSGVYELILILAGGLSMLLAIMLAARPRRAPRAE